MGWQEQMITRIDNPLIPDKPRSVKFYVRYFMNRTQEIFKWSGLPDTIPQKWMEYYLQRNGHACIAKHNGQLYALCGGMGGKLNEYYVPSTYIVNNPYLNLDKEYQIGKDCVLMYGDALATGLYPTIRRYAEMLSEIDISLRMAVIMARATALITAGTGTEKQSADEFIRQLEAGKMSIVGATPVFDSIKAQPLQIGAHNGITDLIEARQYFLAGLYNEIGLNANFNMKRESINSSETELNRDALFPLIDNMLSCRKLACNEVNSMFGTEWRVEFDSVWKLNADTLEETEADTEEGETDETNL